MIRIKPTIKHEAACPHCGTPLDPVRLLWQGIHVCAVCRCPSCNAEIIDDLKCGHSINAPCRVDLQANRLFLEDRPSLSWFGVPFLESLQHPREEPGITLAVERFRECSSVVILNCIDFLYGHSLLKLLNAQQHLDADADHGVVLLIPRFLRWMVPSGVAEVWTVNIPLAEARNYYPELGRRIEQECRRFDEIFLSPAHSHPRRFDITRFTGVAKHDFTRDNYRITFIWREDRPWVVRRLWVRLSRRSTVVRYCLLLWQKYKVIRLFSALRRIYPEARYTVAGLGRTTAFPSWIDDHRAERFDDEAERTTCEIYAQSRLVLGVHGSNMLLPSGHAGMTIELVPEERWSNFAQDLLMCEEDPIMAAYRYRLLPLQASIALLVQVAHFQLRDFRYYRGNVTRGLDFPDGLRKERV